MTDTDFRELIQKRVKEEYGDNPPEEVTERVERELQMIGGSPDAFAPDAFTIKELLYARLAVETMEEAGEYHLARGTAGSSMICYLLGITPVNPLPPHYRCPNCRYAGFVREGAPKSGFDLIGPDHKKACPKCGQLMAGDGHDLPAFFFYRDGGGRKAFHFDVRPEYGKVFRDSAAKVFGAETAARIRYVGEEDRQTEKEPEDPIFTIVFNSLLDQVGELERRTGIRMKDIPIKEIPIKGINIREFFDSGKMEDIPVLKEVYSRLKKELTDELFEELKVSCFSDLVSLLGEAHGTFDIPPLTLDTGEPAPIHAFTHREDIMLYLQKLGIGEEPAFRIADGIGKGRTRAGFGRRDNGMDRELLTEKGVPDMFFLIAEETGYLFPRSHDTDWMIFLFRLMWYREHFPDTYGSVMGTMKEK